MSKPSQRKDDRRRRRQRKKSENSKIFQQRRDAIAKFPEFVFEGDAPDRVVKEVKRTLSDIAAEHEKLFSPPMVEAFRLARKDGFRLVSHTIKQASIAVGKDPDDQWANFSVAPGVLLFSRLPEELFEHYFPFYDVRLLYGTRRGNAITVNCRSLSQQKTKGGTAYFSPQRPTVAVGEDKRTVAFYRHAAERICERTVVDWQSYLGLGDAFAYMHDCIYFEPWIQEGDSGGFTLYEKCEEGFFSWAYANKILGDEEASTGKPYYYRLGYCPAVEAGEFLVATTLLVPGMDGTPECEWYLTNVGRSGNHRRELRRRAEELTKVKLVETGDFSLLKQFHDGGIPQVVELNCEVFRHIV